MKTGVTDPDVPTGSFVVPLFASIFHGLHSISPYLLLRRIPWLCKVNQAAFVDGWVIFNTVLASGAALLAYRRICPSVVTGLSVWACLRVPEMLTSLVDVLLFAEWRARREGRPYAVVGYRRLLLLLLLNYAELVFWFATALLTFWELQWLRLGDPSLAGVLRTAFVAMVSLSLDGVQPLNVHARVLLAVQAPVGAFLTLLTLARLISFLPIPPSKDPMDGPE